MGNTVPQRKRRGDEEEVTTRAGRRRRRSGVWRTAGGGDGAAPAATTVVIVMRRKDAEALVARLNAQSAARERKARMAELKRELRAGAGRCGGASPAEACRDAWRPRFAPIQENEC